MILANIAKQTMNKIITTQKIPSGMEKAPYLEFDNTAYTVKKFLNKKAIMPLSNMAELFSGILNL